MKKRIVLLVLTLLIIGVVGVVSFYFGMINTPTDPGSELSYYRGQYEKCMVIAGNLGFTRIDAIGICRSSVLEAIKFDAYHYSGEDFLEWNDGQWIELKE